MEVLKNMSNNITTITDSNFENEVIKSDLPVLVDFWAPWCGPCKMMGPILDEISVEYAGKIKIGKINVDENNEKSIQYSIRSIPKLILFNQGEIIKEMVGAQSKSTLLDMINDALGL
ncbi:MAG: thioredoxin [bacterium]